MDELSLASLSKRSGACGDNPAGCQLTIGVVFCNWTWACRSYPAVAKPKGVKRAASAVKNRTGRQLARVSATYYRETLWSDLFEGSRPSDACLQPAVLVVETALDLAPSGSAEPTSLDLERARRRRRVVWRLDGGFGTDDKLRWLLARQYQVIAKGFSGC